MFNSRAKKINATINNLVQEFKIGFQSGYEAGRQRGENLRTDSVSDRGVSPVPG